MPCGLVVARRNRSRDAGRQRSSQSIRHASCSFANHRRRVAEKQGGGTHASTTFRFGRGGCSALLRPDSLPQRHLRDDRRHRADVCGRHPAAHDAHINLYFPLPLTLQKENRLPAFEVVWSVHIGSRAITQRTPFQRFLGESSPQM